VREQRPQLYGAAMMLIRRSASSIAAARNRGVALMLVLIAMTIGLLLTAGFVLTQGTSIGIARNERDMERARMLAESGVDMCIWQMKYNTTWRTSMSPGNWLSNYALGAGTVTVAATDTGGNSSFSTNTTNGVKFVSTATVSTCTYTVTATVTPTGGGAIFSSGSFIAAQATLQNGSSINSYDSSVGVYIAGQNATLTTSYSGSNAIAIDITSSFEGNLIGGVNSILTSLVNLLFGGVGPTSVTSAAVQRVSGTVVPPDISGITATPVAFSQSRAGTTTISTANAAYTNFSVSAGTVVFSVPGTYYVSGNLTTSSTGKISVTAPGQVTIVVGGNVTLGTATTVTGQNGNLTIFTGGNATINSSVTNGGSGVSPTIFTLYTTGTGNVSMSGSSTNVYGTVIAPQSQSSFSAGANLFGNLLAASISLNGAKIHIDTSTFTQQFHNFTGGSYLGDYSVVWQQ
jgi:Tfp pilus assembly protein PilX